MSEVWWPGTCGSYMSVEWGVRLLEKLGNLEKAEKAGGMHLRPQSGVKVLEKDIKAVKQEERVIKVMRMWVTLER